MHLVVFDRFMMENDVGARGLMPIDLLTIFVDIKLWMYALS